MSANLFKIEEHVVPCQHIRQYRRATANSQEDVLRLHVKQYTPLNNVNPQPGDVTILAAHANGFPKELYEPLWDAILARSASSGFRIRGIWIADVAWQGQSLVLNEDLLGNDPSWFDHSLDLLNLINTKREQIPEPIVGIGHSFGGCQLTYLALFHPRILTTLVLLDPVIEGSFTEAPLKRRRHLVQLSTFRRDLWPSREDAEAGIRRSPLYSTWDPRVLDLYIKYAIRPLPTAIFPSPEDPKQVTLTTPIHQEVFTFLRPNYYFDPATDDPSTLNRKEYPDLDWKIPNTKPIHRPESPYIFRHLEELRPSVLYVLGGQSDILDPSTREERTNKTGTGVGGSGGVALGRVSAVTLSGAGHLFPMTDVDRTAEPAATWLGKELKRWRDDEAEFRMEWDKKTKIEKMTVDDRWKEMVGGDPRKNKVKVRSPM